MNKFVAITQYQDFLIAMTEDGKLYKIIIEPYNDVLVPKIWLISKLPEE